MSKLTAKSVENAQPKAKEYKLSDGSGLYLRVRSSGAKKVGCSVFVCQMIGV